MSTAMVGWPKAMFSTTLAVFDLGCSPVHIPVSFTAMIADQGLRTEG